MAANDYPREEIFNLMKAEAWADVVDEVCRHKIFSIKNDSMAEYVIRTMKEEFIRYIDKLPASEQVAKMRTISLEILHTPGIFQADFENEIITRKLNALWESDRVSLVSYANNYVGTMTPGLESAAKLARHLLLKVRDHSPESVAKSRNQGIRILVEGEKPSDVTSVLCQSLFKSPQEEMFYRVLVRLFPESIVQANCAIHTALDWELAKDRLTGPERDFFFKGLFDFVVFSGEETLPVAFYELDSSYHNTARAQGNDTLKNAIAKKCSIRLFRIGPLEEASRNEAAFTKLVNDLMIDRS